MRATDFHSFLAAGQRLAEAGWASTQEAPLLLLAALAGLALWIGAASLAASRAEHGGHPPLRQWLLGLLLPLAYPLWVIFALKPVPMPVMPEPAGSLGGTETKRRLQLPSSKAAEPPLPAAAETAPTPAAPPVAAPAAPATWDQPFFEQLARQQVVTPVSPCFITLNDHELAVTAILEALPQLVIVQIRQRDGHTQRLRIPYIGICHLQLPNQPLQ